MKSVIEILTDEFAKGAWWKQSTPSAQAAAFDQALKDKDLIIVSKRQWETAVRIWMVLGKADDALRIKMPRPSSRKTESVEIRTVVMDKGESERLKACAEIVKQAVKEAHEG